MAPWGDAKLFFCILFITCCCTVTLAQVPMDCCLSVKNQTIPNRLAANYRRQFSGQGCTLDATVLVTRNNMKLCVPAGEPWVLIVMKHVDSLRKHCKETNYKGKRCTGVKPE
ncbi:C-C motif chemokine 19a.1 [Pagrus major]|uniref:C-C motif chemokine 19a.1 n=1 Tax=Pagrus major TaxID=143350 RepID=UPI003CC8C689